MEMLQILARETENTHSAFIYEENGRWFAYETSAWLLDKFMQGVLKVKSFICTAYDVILDRVEIDLGILLEKCQITSCSDTELVISVK